MSNVSKIMGTPISPWFPHGALGATHKMFLAVVSADPVLGLEV